MPLSDTHGFRVLLQAIRIQARRAEPSASLERMERRLAQAREAEGRRHWLAYETGLLHLAAEVLQALEDHHQAVAQGEPGLVADPAGPGALAPREARELEDLQAGLQRAFLEREGLSPTAR